MGHDDAVAAAADWMKEESYRKDAPMLIRSLIAVSISLVFAASPSAEDAVESKTPPAEHFQFQGNQTFTDAQLRRALVADPDVLLAIHPLGTSDKLADRLTETLVAGYRGHGFPSPKVNVQPTTDPIGATISIEEGRRRDPGL